MAAKKRNSLKNMRSVLAREMEELGRKALDRCGLRHGAANDQGPDKLYAVFKLCRNLDLKQWKALSKQSEFKEWLAMPLNEDAFPSIRHLQNRLEELAYQTEHDPLTGLYNRRAFSHIMNLELQRASREGHHLSLAMIDLDDFKQVNDTYGHPCGDEVLVGLARTLSSSMRVYDTVARIGGEEFAVIMPSAGPNTAIGIMRRLLGDFSKLSFACQDKPGFTVTFSAGLAHTKGKKPVSPEKFIQEADEALYKAKGQGKSRVVFRRSLKAESGIKPTMVRSEEKRFLFSGGK